MDLYAMQCLKDVATNEILITADRYVNLFTNICRNKEPKKKLQKKKTNQGNQGNQGYLNQSGQWGQSKPIGAIREILTNQGNQNQL